MKKILPILLLLLFLAPLCQAGEYHGAIYAITSIANDAGYDPGFGVAANVSARWSVVELVASASFLNQKKEGAESGYVYSYGLEGRGYVHGPFYFLLSSQWSGYDTEFDDGRKWAKNAHHFGAGVGFNNGDTDLSVAYFFKENDTPNRTEFISAHIEQRLYKHLFGMGTLTRMEFDQGGDRANGWTGALGIGVKW